MDAGHVAVVGLGPRGLSVLERLCANAPGLLAGRALRVTVVDPHVGRGGRVWRRDQDPALLMNTVACQVSMFVDDSVECAGPVVPGPSLYEWARARPDLPAWAAAEARALGPDDYPSRALYGCYLRWVLDRVLRTAPVRVELHGATALDLRTAPDGSQELVLDDGTVVTGVDSVVLVQGHLPTAPTPWERAAADFAARTGTRYVPPGNPADLDLSGVRPGEPVLLNGLGLTFFDHLALLTTGRGGRFKRSADDRLAYLPSGQEPELVAGSRRGVPYQARGENQKGAAGRHTPLFLTPATASRLRRGPADFRRDVWPLIDLEVRSVYYPALAGKPGADEAVRRFAATAAGQVVPPPDDPFAVVESAAERRLRADLGVVDLPRWDWARVAVPYGTAELVSGPAFRAWLRRHLGEDVREARRGNVDSPLKAALDVLRDLRNEIRLVVDHGGLSGQSYRDDLRGWYTPLNAYLSIGPPARRVEELVALVDAGVVRLLGPGLAVRLDADAGVFRARSTLVPGDEVAATTLVEARLAEGDLHTTTDPLLRALAARGDVGAHRIHGPASSVYATGGLAVTTRPYRVVDAAGRAHPGRFAFGVPTETVHWVTAAGIRPWVNSVILSDADAVARAAVEHALSHPRTR